MCIRDSDYTAQRKAGKDPVFVADTIEGLPPTECWHVEELKEYGKPPVKELSLIHISKRRQS